MYHELLQGARRGRGMFSLRGSYMAVDLLGEIAPTFFIAYGASISQLLGKNWTGQVRSGRYAVVEVQTLTEFSTNSRFWHLTCCNLDIIHGPGQKMNTSCSDIAFWPSGGQPMLLTLVDPILVFSD